MYQVYIMCSIGLNMVRAALYSIFFFVLVFSNSLILCLLTTNRGMHYIFCCMPVLSYSMCWDSHTHLQVRAFDIAFLSNHAMYMNDCLVSFKIQLPQ